MATPEGKVKGWLDKMLKDLGIWFFSPQAGPYGVAGIPDRIAIVCGLFVGIEVKADAKRKMTALQERCKEKIEAAGGYHFLVYDKETIETVRQFIVSTRSSRQEGGGGSVSRARRYSQCDTVGKTCARELSASAAQAGGNTSPPQLGA